jgi:outer membrane receptor protein involved in Fe transport
VGNFEATLDAAYLDRFRTFIPQPDGTIVVDDRAGKSDQPRSTFPHWKGQASLRYSKGPFDAGWKARYIGDSDDIPGNAVNGGHYASVIYHDFQFGYELGDGASQIALGIDNAFDRLPPASAANNPINFDIYTYDIRGRYWYAKLSMKF